MILMKNCCSIEMESEIQMVESIEFEPVTLERLGCIPTRSIGTRNRLFYLNNLSHRHVVKLNCLKPDKIREFF